MIIKKIINKDLIIKMGKRKRSSGMLHYIFKEERRLLVLMVLILTYIGIALAISAYIEYHLSSSSYTGFVKSFWEDLEWLISLFKK